VKLGARSQQSAALAQLAIPVILRLGMIPSERMVRTAAWGEEHDIHPWWDFRLAGVKTKGKR
jgi:hypothetical protein